MGNLIGIGQVSRKIGRTRWTVNRYLADATLGFPRPVRVGDAGRMWHEREVDAWVAGLPRIDATDTQPVPPPAA